MVVVDSSVLIPLSWVGELDLITGTFGDIHTTEEVRDEVAIDGRRGVSALRTFLTDASIHPAPDGAARTADLEGIATTDAAVILLANELADDLLANDKGLIEVAQTQGIECWWVTTVLLSATKDGSRSSKEASDILYELVDNGMYLHPKVYSKVLQAIEDIGS